MYEIGTGKADITAFKPGIGMMGYGVFHNRIDGVETKLFARAFAFRNPESGKKVVFVNAEMCFMTISVKRGVIKRLQRKYAELGYDYPNVFLTAQHTHSGPAGYSHYGLYNISTPGFVPEVYKVFVDGIVDAIVEADKNLKPATLKMHKGSFAPEIDVAFNRSIKAYNRNPEVEPKVEPKDWHLAVNREMTLFRADTAEGTPIGAFNFFGLHCTSVHNDNTKINADNKGYAAVFHEKDLKKTNPDFVSIFAQNITGDVTPNYVWDKKKKWTRGPYENDVESAKYSGRLQFEKAKEIFEDINNGVTLQGNNIDFGLMYVNFAKVTADPEFTGGNTDAQTGPTCHGVAFLKGTVEGPGMDAVGAAAAITASQTIKRYEQTIAALHLVSKKERKRIWHKYKVQGKKNIIIESGERKLLGTYNVKSVVVPGFVDPTIKYFKYFHKKGALDHKPWTAQTLPLQMMILDNIAFCSVPGEITTIAGQRLQNTILEVLKERGVTEVIICTYANAYSGYITTYEEYQAQCYEGGHTLFGEYTLAAFQTKYREFAQEMLKPAEERTVDSTISPVEFTDAELHKKLFTF